MFLKEKNNGHLVEILSLTELFDLYQQEVVGRYHYGEEIQDPEKFSKQNLIFQSGEPLPRCWIDPHYREAELKR
ncbi:acetyltransferase [Spartinivicinus poritis]|uniref:Acetyltransferase n=1 Tax=Spartinivicinus poritis TaxID=2994640 RepID=A0ABT5U358_9GAMM|nr:acetyltransferase [Spartinivicinus sp. A2-2]MDE1460742.1 acetyltransferase [Spartinivicinus sp. A2-2]